MTARSSYAEHATPVIIAGAPRSGTTFLTTSLNSHPQIVITNELRAWTVFNDVRRRTNKPNQLLPKHPARDLFRDALLENFADFFRNFYASSIDKTNVGCPTKQGDSVEPMIRAYGDKNPGYADANSQGCLDFIAEALPDARFLHIHRDPRSCVASYRDIEVYSDEIERRVDTWNRHAGTMAALRDRLGPERVLEFAYESYVTEEGDQLFRMIEDHLGVDHASEPLSFLARERAEPIPYRSPTTPKERLGRATFNERLDREEIARVEHACAALMERYGYAPVAA